jgi:Ca-activated chloride channel family protein
VSAALGHLGPLSLEQPLLLAALLALVLVALRRAAGREPASLPWPALDEARAAGARRREPVRWLGRGLRVGALASLGVVLAGPLARVGNGARASRGLDLVLVLDASASMRALDAEVEGEWGSRIDLAREVVRRFALHRVADGDRVGLVVFGETAFTQCPLTHDGSLLAAALARVSAGMAGEATALGDALALAVKRVAPAPPGRPAAAPGAGRVVVLLSDGRSNAGEIPPDVAVALARRAGVRVHTVGIGSRGEVPVAAPEGQAGRGLRFERHDLDAEGLARAAAATGGRYFEARRPSQLEAVYAEIDALERVPRERREPPSTAPRPEPFLALAGGCLLVELAATRALRRPLP